MRCCVCSACPLSSSHHSDVTFSSTERNTEPQLLRLLILPLKPIPFLFPVMPNVHSWKPHRGWVGYPGCTSTKSHSLNSPGYSTSDWVSKRHWVGWQLINGVREWHPHHIFHISHSSWEKWNIWSRSESSLLVSCVGYGGSRGACGAMVIWHKNISDVTLTNHMLCQRGKDLHKHKHFFTALSKTGPYRIRQQPKEWFLDHSPICMSLSMIILLCI